MFKRLIVTLILLFAVSAFAEDSFDDIVEVMGNVSVTKTYAYEEPSFKSKALAKLSKNSKVLITKQDDEWLQIRLFNNSVGWVYAKYVSFRLNNVTKNESESKVMIDIENLLEQFNDTVQSSWYAEKQKVIPSLTVHSGRRADDIYLLFSAVNSNGEYVPSLKENPLQKDMIKLIELVYMKMLVMPYNRYRITLLVPDFISGTYKGRTDTYDTLTLDKNFANIDEIKNGTGSIWDYVRSQKRPEEMFLEYPH